MTELTYISTIEITNYTNVADLKAIILKTLARWFPNSYVFNEGAVESWIHGNAFLFELSITDENVYKLTMYANGRLRRQGSSCDFFEMILECLEFQIKHPERDFDTMIDCHKEDDTVASLEDEDDTVASLDELIMSMPLREMNDAQIEKYVERIGQYPRDECDEWIMVYAGGAILRYSYCNFSQWHIEDQTVSNITITRAIFEETTFTNYVFNNVKFDECVFMDVILNNTTFKNCKFIECEFDSSMVLDKSCEVVNYNHDDDDHIHITYY